MRILAFSDLHLSASHAADIVSASALADIVIGVGDFCNYRNCLDDAVNMLANLAAPLIAVPGNAESEDELRAAALDNWHVLHGDGMVIDGVSIFGIGYGVPVTPFGDWSCDLTEAEAANLLAHCKSADILITHSPPKGIADQTSNKQSVGSAAVRDWVTQVQPKLVLCGHIHEAWGQSGAIGAASVHNLGPIPNWFDVTA